MIPIKIIVPVLTLTFVNCGQSKHIQYPKPFRSDQVRVEGNIIYDGESIYAEIFPFTDLNNNLAGIGIVYEGQPSGYWIEPKNGKGLGYEDEDLTMKQRFDKWNLYGAKHTTKLRPAYSNLEILHDGKIIKFKYANSPVSFKYNVQTMEKTVTPDLLK